MFKLKILLAILPIIALFSSCLTGLHQLVTYDKVTADNRVVGTWQQDNSTMLKIESLATSDFAKSITGAKVEKEEINIGFSSREDSVLYSNSYLVQFTKKGYTYYMAASLMTLNGEIFADILPAGVAPLMPPASKDINDLFSGIGYTPSHTIAKISIKENSLQVKFLNGDFIKNQLSKGVMAVKYENDPLFNTTLVTASSAELERFITKYGNDERLYSAENTITLKKI